MARMKRDLYHALPTWKASSRRKPLLLKGARQTGKTYLLKNFGSDADDRVLYFNFEEEPAVDTFFERNLKPTRILNELSIYSEVEIHPETDLVIFDEYRRLIGRSTPSSIFKKKPLLTILLLPVPY